MAVDDNERRRAFNPAKNLDCLRQPLLVVASADLLHVPAIGEKPRRDIFAKGQIRMALDRDPVAVVEPAKIIEHLLARERRYLARHALHHVAVAAYGIDVIVEYREIRPVEVLSQPAPGERHADAVATTLAQRAGCRFDARREVIFGMAGAFAAELPKSLDIVQRDRGLAETSVIGIYRFHSAEMKRRVEKH